MSYILGFDLGTSSCKAIIFDEKLNVIYQSGCEYPTYFPRKDCAEQNAENWWKSFCSTVLECLEKSGVSPADIEVVGVDSMGSAVLPIDKYGVPLRPAMLWMDRRSQKQCEDIHRELGERLFEISGNNNDPSNIAPKVMWIKENEPEVYENTWKFMHANGYLVYKLTGMASQDLSEGGLSQLYDIRAGKWSEELFEGCGIQRDKLPDLYKCSDIVGKVTFEAAAACGLATGTPVIAGAMDVVASALGTGSINEGEVYIAGGTVTAVGIIIDRVKPHPALHLHNHIIPDKYIAVSGVDFGGGGLRWFRNLLEKCDYKEFDYLASLAPPGNNGLIFLPYMVGQRSPFYNNNTTGVAFGITPDHEMKHLIRMFMEGTAYGVRNILEYFSMAGAFPIRSKMTGGLSNGHIWPQILTDIIGINVQIPASVDVAAMGSALTGGVAVGIFPDYKTGLEYQNSVREYKVGLQNIEVYDKTFTLFKKLYKDISSCYDFAKDTLAK